MAQAMIFGRVQPTTNTELSNWDYVVGDSMTHVYKYKGGSSNVVVPEKIAGKPVHLETGENNPYGFSPFSDLYSVVSVTIPNTVTITNNDAIGLFRGCWNLRKVIFPNSVQSISGNFVSGMNYYLQYDDSYMEVMGNNFGLIFPNSITDMSFAYSNGSYYGGGGQGYLAGLGPFLGPNVQNAAYCFDNSMFVDSYEWYYTEDVSPGTKFFVTSPLLPNVETINLTGMYKNARYLSGTSLEALQKTSTVFPNLIPQASEQRTSIIADSMFENFVLDLTLNMPGARSQNFVQSLIFPANIRSMQNCFNGMALNNPSIINTQNSADGSGNYLTFETKFIIPSSDGGTVNLHRAFYNCGTCIGGFAQSNITNLPYTFPISVECEVGMGNFFEAFCAPSPVEPSYDYTPTINNTNQSFYRPFKNINITCTNGIDFRNACQNVTLRSINIKFTHPEYVNGGHNLDFSSAFENAKGYQIHTKNEYYYSETPDSLTINIDAIPSNLSNAFRNIQMYSTYGYGGNYAQDCGLTINMRSNMLVPSSINMANAFRNSIGFNPNYYIPQFDQTTNLYYAYADTHQAGLYEDDYYGTTLPAVKSSVKLNNNIQNMVGAYCNSQLFSGVAGNMPNQVTNYYQTFQGVYNLNARINLTTNNNITNMTNMFYGCNVSKAKIVYAYGGTTTWSTANSAINNQNGVYLFNENLRTNGTYFNSLFTYTNNGSNIIITNYKGTSTTVHIPDKFNGKNIYIQSNLFYNNQNIEYVYIDPNAKMVNNSAYQLFYNCNNLKAVPIIPRYTSNLTQSFWNCTKLTQGVLVLPLYIQNMYQSFYNCNNMKKFPIESDYYVDIYDNYGGYTRVPNSRVTNMAYSYYNCRSAVGSVSIPMKVTNGAHAFAYCSNLSDITFYTNCAGVSNFSSIAWNAGTGRGSIYFHNSLAKTGVYNLYQAFLNSRFSYISGCFGARNTYQMCYNTPNLTSMYLSVYGGINAYCGLGYGANAVTSCTLSLYSHEYYSDEYQSGGSYYQAYPQNASGSVYCYSHDLSQLGHNIFYQTNANKQKHIYAFPGTSIWNNLNSSLSTLNSYNVKFSNLTTYEEY